MRARVRRRRTEQLNAADTGLWERADAQNPNPARFVPVQITGFAKLHERRQQQLQAARDVLTKLSESEAKLQALEDERQVGIALRLRHYAERQQLLAHRVLRLYVALERQHLLRCHGGVEPPLGGTEIAYIRRLQELAAEMSAPDANRLYEVAAQLQSEAAAAERAHGGAGLADGHRVRLDQLEGWLAKQQDAVRKLIELSQRDLADIGIALSEAQHANQSAVGA